MRSTLLLFFLVLSLSVAAPAQAQFRGDASGQQAAARVYDEGRFEAALDKVFSEEHFRMGHSYEMSYSSLGGQSASMGMYTSSLMWQFDQKLAARVDVGLMQPFSGDLFGQDHSPRLFLRNAEIAYRPSENMQIHLQMRQSPYGGYLGSRGGFYSPYGNAYGSPYGGSGFNMRAGTAPHDLFWNDDQPR